MDYSARLNKVRAWMAEEGIDLLMLEDIEGQRDQNIRYLTGHPTDALLLLPLEKPANGEAILVAWDINLAKICTREAPVLLASYNDFGKQPIKVLSAAAQKLNLSAGSKIEIPSVTPYPVFLDYVGELTNYDILCREKGYAAELRKQRAVKNNEEIAILQKAASITNELIDLLEKKVRKEKIKTEADAAMLIELECRKHGCEGTSFGTLAAGPDRSFGIHAFPGWTCAPFGTQGFSILDFGVKYRGYCTDVTLTFACDLNPKQERLAGLVEKAAKLAFSMARNGTAAKEISAAVDALFSRSRKQMPHSLGHGIGLQEHEYPVIRNRSDNEWVLEPGMVFTIEPGLYDQTLGGCRLENDILMTETAAQVLTTARIIHL
ncbi:MAG: Xaa-Pro peptidase family protein [Treponema sp.]|nr:Xaa-Pro peptidase family protein [Treponema sp.]MCL2271533.1 Xaa-Pro peptidase family protein [Treponema sp.]